MGEFPWGVLLITVGTFGGGVLKFPKGPYSLQGYMWKGFKRGVVKINILKCPQTFGGKKFGGLHLS